MFVQLPVGSLTLKLRKKVLQAGGNADLLVCGKGVIESDLFILFNIQHVQ